MDELQKTRLLLADGTVLEDSDCGYAEYELHCWIRNRSLAETFNLFTDPEKTKVIRFCYADQEIIYRNFTDITLIRKMEDHIEVRLVGGTRGGTVNGKQDETEQFDRI